MNSSDLAQRRARLTPEQREKLAQRLAGASTPARQSDIPRRNPFDPAPLSYAQQRHWFLWQLEPLGTAYHLSGGLRLAGELDIEALRSSFEALGRRHESLRTVFRANAEGLPEQIIEAEPKLDIPLIDFSGLPREQGAACAHEEASRISATPFDLTQGPLLRLALIRIAPEEHLLVVVMHHIISDAWSNRIVIDEFAAHYRAQVNGHGHEGQEQGQGPSLPALPIQYADYAIWQRNWLEAGEKERQLAYWRSQLGEEHPVLQLPTDHPRSSNANYRAARHTFTLPAGLVARLQRQAQSQGATLFMVFLAGFQALLHRYTGQQDIRVGVPIANRHRVEIENIVGFFVNTQVLRNRIDGRMPLKAVLDQTRETALGAQTHQDLPFEQLVEALQPERNLNQNPLFQVMYNHLREDYRALEQLPGLTVENHELSEQAAQFELTLDTVEQPDGRLEATFTYAAELFEPATIERLGGHYLHLLEQLAEHPEQSLGDIDILSEGERAQLRAWGVNEKRYGNTEPVHRLIERQVEERAGAVALIFGDAQLSYAELNRRANRLAHRLIALGVKPETKVGIAVERSIDMIVGLLAILKAGGAYVPLDPEYPQERLSYMAADSAIGLLLTQSHIRARIPCPAQCQVLELDVLDLEDGPDGNPQVCLHGQNLAYVIYTSGSTGKPKGVTVRHSALSDFLASMGEFPGAGADDTLLAVTALSFDIAALELYLPLSVGARLVLVPHGVSRDGLALAQLLQNHRPSILQSTPAGWRMLLAAGWHGLQGEVEPSKALKALCGGESLQPDLAAQLRARGVELWNMYGPTETTIWSAVGRIGQDGATPLGKPIPGTEAYILDPHLNPVPQGVAGELYLGGVGLARGYLNRGGLTAERFIADPFDEGGGRLYRTGDLARWRADGQIEYLGRLDHQVKIRGFRIELGEIETQLLAQPEVREAVVVAREGSGTPNATGGARLVAYVSPHAGVNVDVALLREALAKALPDYMIPSAIVVLESLPLNPNGKVDRKALPEPEFVNTENYEAPQGEVEEVLAGIWAGVLGVGQVGRHDNFFELGGDSILSLQIVTKARRAGWKITPRQLFERQTIASLAEVAEIIEEPMATPAKPERGYLRHYLDPEVVATLAFTDDEIEDVYPLSPTQEGMLFHTLETAAEGTGLYVNQLSVEVEGLDAQRFARAWQAMVARHSVLRTGFLWQVGLARPLQIVFKKVDAPIVHLDWRGLDGLESRIGAYAKEELKREFDFLAPPLARLVLIRLAEDRYQLIWTRHHILLDAWGDSVLISDWLRGYDGQTLASLGPDYGYYIRWLAEQDAQATRTFWQSELREVEGPTLLAKASGKAEKLDQPDRRSEFAQIYTRLGSEETRQLKAFAQRQQVTLNTVVQAAWALLLQRYTGKETVVFGATVAGRPPSLPKADEILGMFINTIPVPVARRSDLSVAEYLSLLQKTNARLREHEHASLADIQRWAGSSGRPLFDSIVVFENYPIDEAMRSNELYGLRFGEIEGKGLTGYAMDLQVVVSDVLEIEYCYGRLDFSDEFVLDLRRHMEFLMREMLAHPQRAVGELGWMERWELDKLFSLGSNAHTGDIPEPLPRQPVHRLIEHNAAQQPDAIALLMGERELCYAELNIRANRLAQYLISVGVGPEVRVGVAMERSLEVIVTLLAVLKAGGAYVPLDSEYPVDRLSFMIKDSGMSLLVTEEKLVTKLGGILPVRTLVLDSLDLSAESGLNPDIPIHEHNLAYIIYTSGSTGLPKGVTVAHGPLTMHCRATAEIYGMSPLSCELLFMSFSFDGAHERWLTALTVGAGLAVRDQELWTAEQTYDALHSYGITNAAFPPAYLGQVAEWASPRSDPPPVELYVFGGEAMPKASYDLVRKTLRPRILINGYGPTETVVTPLIWKTEASNSFDCAYAPIGRPVGERTAYVLDVDMQPVPLGVVGELYIGGYGLARGYLGRAGLTAERFVADPFDANGGRLYRTGDLVRWLDDGNIEYIGRADHQVKIRGFRIELGEIEACIRELAGMTAVTVVVHHGVAGPQLAAYVVPATPVEGGFSQDLISSLKQQLAKRLPEYMVPAHIVALETLPRLSSGKLDRSALPEPDAIAGDTYRAPSTPEARLLAKIWQEVLGVDRVGETDNFFALGGDSLSSLKVMARMRNVPGAKFEFKLRDLMQRPTIAGLLGLDVQVLPKTQALLLLNQPGEKAKAEPLFCIHAGLGTVFDYQPLARQLHGKRTVYGLPSRMLADPAHCDASLAQMAADYCQIIRQMQPEGPYHLLGWSLGGTLAAMIAALLEAEAQTVAFLSLIDPFIPGTDEPEPDDWRQDFSDFVSVVLSGAKIEGVGSVYSNENLTSLEQPSEQIIASLLEALISAEQARRGTAGSNSAEIGGYADMGAGELARIFTVARHLKALAAQTPSLSRLNIQPSCWWVAARPLPERLALARQIDQVESVSNEINTDHFAIVRAGPLLLGIKSALENLNSQNTFLPT